MNKNTYLFLSSASLITCCLQMIFFFKDIIGNGLKCICSVNNSSFNYCSFLKLFTLTNCLFSLIISCICFRLPSVFKFMRRIFSLANISQIESMKIVLAHLALKLIIQYVILGNREKILFAPNTTWLRIHSFTMYWNFVGKFKTFPTLCRLL